MNCRGNTISENHFQRYAFVSLGANLDSALGSPTQTIQHAITLIAEFSSQPLLTSTLIETTPLDCPPGSPLFTNAMLALIPDSEETPISLLKRLQAIENSLGRTRSGQVNEARVLDLDLITFKDQISVTEELILPHPRASIRKFVLEPLFEITGNVIFPGQTLLIEDLIQAL